MKLYQWLITGLTSMALVACGGGGSIAPATPPDTSTPVAASVELATSATQIGSGSGVATITATVKSASNVSIASAPITFSADSGVLANAVATTGTNGTATVELSAGADKTSRTITVTARSGTVSKTIQVQIVAAQRKIEVVTSVTQIGSGGEEATITAVVKDENNVSLSGAPVAFSTTSGTLAGASTVTNAAGIATARLSAGADKSNRTITVTATSGTVAQTVQVLVVDTKLTYSGATTVALGKVAAISVKLADSRSVPIGGVAVAVTSSLNNGLSATSATTDGQGVATLNYTATNAGNDTLTFTAIGATASVQIQISGEDFSFISPAANVKIPVQTSQVVTVKYVKNGAPVANQMVAFSITGGTITPSSIATDANGLASATISSTTASPATVTAALQGVVAQTSLPVQFVAVVPAKLTLQATPTALAPNAAGSTTQQAQLIATVVDADSNPVQGVTVNFNRVADPSGGNLNQASAVTDATGRASVQYISGGITTASNGVLLRAVVASTPTVSGEATLTVNQSALFIALGTGNVIQNIDSQTYKKDWVVYVTDANGVAVPNVSLTMKLLPRAYGKGSLVWNGTVWTYGPNVIFCANEDLNYNGKVDAGEDINGNNTLQPGNVISVNTGTSTTPGTVTTDASGRATVSVIYAESYSPWVVVALRAEAIVTGTESGTEAVFTVESLSADVTSETVPPAGQFSPFGSRACNLPN